MGLENAGLLTSEEVCFQEIPYSISKVGTLLMGTYKNLKESHSHCIFAII